MEEALAVMHRKSFVKYVLFFLSLVLMTLSLFLRVHDANDNVAFNSSMEEGNDTSDDVIIQGL